MVVLIMSKVPASLRGEVSHWLQEIDTGVFVGNINRLVREELWKIISSKIGDSPVLLLWTTNNEQGFDLIHQNRTDYLPEDFEGLWLFGKVKKN